MFSCIYVEHEIRSHSTVERILQRFDQVPVVLIEHYGEVFNRKGQNFKIQKQHPALILARKTDKFVHLAPDNFGLGGQHNYYFSHMLNCIYDCRYCFLQGMYRSANYVLFVNYDGFSEVITKLTNQHENETSYFYSGYDCDSLALEPVTRFVEYFLPVFATLPNAVLELRTKSTQIRTLLEMPPQENIVIAFSFTPDSISTSLEHRVSSNQKRFAAMKKLQQQGWKIGLRFDPLVYEDNYYNNYHKLFDEVFSHLDVSCLHSVSMGTFRLPKAYYQSIVRLYPQEKLFAARLKHGDGMVGYGQDLESQMINDCVDMLLNQIPSELYFPCSVRSSYAG